MKLIKEVRTIFQDYFEITIVKEYDPEGRLIHEMHNDHTPNGNSEEIFYVYDDKNRIKEIRTTIHDHDEHISKIKAIREYFENGYSEIVYLESYSERDDIHTDYINYYKREFHNSNKILVIKEIKQNQNGNVIFESFQDLDKTNIKETTECEYENNLIKSKKEVTSNKSHIELTEFHYSGDYNNEVIHYRIEDGKKAIKSIEKFYKDEKISREEKWVASNNKFFLDDIEICEHGYNSEIKFHVHIDKCSMVWDYDDIESVPFEYNDIENAYQILLKENFIGYYIQKIEYKYRDGLINEITGSLPYRWGAKIETSTVTKYHNEFNEQKKIEFIIEFSIEENGFDGNSPKKFEYIDSIAKFYYEK